MFLPFDYLLTVQFRIIQICNIDTFANLVTLLLSFLLIPKEIHGKQSKSIKFRIKKKLLENLTYLIENAKCWENTLFKSICIYLIVINNFSD